MARTEPLTRVALVLATVAGAGFFPFASGTFASVLAIAPYWALRTRPGWFAGVTIALFFLGVWSSGEAERALGEKDPHAVVIDEVVGYLVATAFLPLNWFYPLAALVLFRVFDVWKPWFIHGSQKLPGGWGIMLDDWFAGLFANLLLQGWHWFLKW